MILNQWHAFQHTHYYVSTEGSGCIMCLHHICTYTKQSSLCLVFLYFASQCPQGKLARLTSVRLQQPQNQPVPFSVSGGAQNRSFSALV